MVGFGKMALVIDLERAINSGLNSIFPSHSKCKTINQVLSLYLLLPLLSLTISRSPRSFLSPRCLSVSTIHALQTTMKAISNIVLAGLAAQASALVQMEVRYSDNMIDVGNLDLFAATWDAIYGEAGNTRAIMMDRSTGTQTNECTHASDYDPDLTVRVRINGAWGRTPGLSDNQMRDGLVQSAWEVLNRVADPYGYEVFNGCRGLTWQESVGYTSDAACGPSSSRNCEHACRNENSPGKAECKNLTWGHKVPSSLRVTAYIDGRLQPDDLIIEFGAQSNTTPGGCGLVGTIAGALAGFVPVAGDVFAVGIDVGCSI
ncbi:hypothetical protein CTA2_10655 [Colletotrichum tanaceti]|uniref:Uncharacterized protein n=1 Tax=Colletotrichum tanaceti TaxID=1306861 RepID=A0A4U6XDB0_9PEZI|nr:hypothetical protein CTA2_10655 [Colletotrichum tanaceti]TKW53751.1 hypothetical protein CTA1_985 [Colletotrichum tanaceti]